MKVCRKHCEAKKLPFTESLYDRLDLHKEASLEAIIKESSLIAEKKTLLEVLSVGYEIFLNSDLGKAAVRNRSEPFSGAVPTGNL